MFPRFDLSRLWELGLGSVKGLKLELDFPTRARGPWVPARSSPFPVSGLGFHVIFHVMIFSASDRLEDSSALVSFTGEIR